MDKASDFESEDWGFKSLRGWMSLNLHKHVQCSVLDSNWNAECAVHTMRKTPNIDLDHNKSFFMRLLFYSISQGLKTRCALTRI